jgi:hypothetical protein
MPECRCQAHAEAGVWACLIPGCNDAGTHRAPGGSERQWLCGRHFGEFIAHVQDPVHHPVFPLPEE